MQSCLLSKVPLEVLQNWALIQLMDTPHILENVQGLIKELFQIIGPCIVIRTGEYAALILFVLFHLFQHFKIQNIKRIPNKLMDIRSLTKGRARHKKLYIWLVESKSQCQCLFHERSMKKWNYKENHDLLEIQNWWTQLRNKNKADYTSKCLQDTKNS